ncbi:aldehyde decarbonylase protein [Dioscorea alata]|uniref:Aldehyde decarbonylase protein n=1 Tax=Dioscorea alata TaxID=55571 RepID=A0ACB7U0U3_DIOAL|nr:aldehyde decarbonylase protein [Dioscorea alata]
MATKPGYLTQWPWQSLGNFKYLLLAPWVVDGAHKAMRDGWNVDLTYLAILPLVLSRVLHNLVWISLSRFQNARSKHRILDRSLDFDQVDRERNWDDQILFGGFIAYSISMCFTDATNLPIWRMDGWVIIMLLHAGPVEFLYYWFHRALHHHFLYSRYHSHHHASIVTEPITSVIHPFAEHIVYYFLFFMPLLTSIFTKTSSILAIFLYITYVDFMNNMGHCNFELVPNWLFKVFPPLKYLMYTPSYHSLHHTQFRTNYSLFMPFYDYIYNTMDKSSDCLYETSLKGKEEKCDVIHLTHPTTLQSIYHLRFGFPSLASKPYDSKWYMMLVWPLSLISMAFTWIYGSCFTIERNKLKKLIMQTWAIPRYSFQYELSWEKDAINHLIEKAILQADCRGVRVLSLGLLNQGREINGYGELYLRKHPNLNLRIVDGSSLAAAVVLKSIPSGTKQVLLVGTLSKIGCAITTELCKKGIQVSLTSKPDFHYLKSSMSGSTGRHLTFTRKYTPQVWLIGEGMDHEEQMMALKGTIFIPFSQFPLKKVRKDCTYYSTPAMRIPDELENIHSCENWLPRRVMSAWRIAGIIHALEGWNEHECGDTMLDIEKVWSAAILHGFLPLTQA